jgi:two-component system cell cycle sensor histidine kinase/response regulator CckA
LNETVEKVDIIRGTETILLVDDENFVRDLGQEMLQQAGYKVFTAQTGKEALEIYREQRDAISLVLLDLIMPEMSGRQCISGILQSNPEAKVLIISGYSLETGLTEALAIGAQGFVSKPFDVAKFLQQVRNVLDGT